MTDTADKTTADAPADWEALLAAASFEDKMVVAKRATVTVPEPVLAAVKNAHATGKYIFLPYNADKFAETADIFYSAGDLLEPKVSVGIVRVVREVGKKDVVLKVKDEDKGVTHIRISVAQRRGAKGKTADKAPADKAKTPDKAPADKGNKTDA